MHILRPYFLRIRRVCFLCLIVLCILGPSQPLLAQEGVIYLPVVSGTPPTELVGTVTFEGNPAAGQYIALYRYSRTDSVLIATVATDSRGMFRFVDPEPLLTDQWYGAEYRNGEHGNPASENLIGYCATYSIDEFTPGTRTQLGDFDIAGIIYRAPAHYSVVELPTNFQWYTRTGTPLDNFSLYMFDRSDNSNDRVRLNFWDLGNVDNFTVVREHFPVDAELAGHQFGWYLGIDWNRSFCNSSVSQTVIFKP